MSVSSLNNSSVQSTQEPTQLQKTRASADVQRREEAPEAKPEPATKATPVINTQGQTTGQLLNVVA